MLTIRTLRPTLLASLVPLAACGATPAANETAVAANPAAPVTEDQTPAMREYAEANERMHSGMGGAIDRDPDVAFVRGMIPHHQGAVEMAEIVRRHGQDPETQALAESVIRAQRAEIAQMEAWLAKRGLSATAGPAAGNAVDHGAMGH